MSEIDLSAPETQEKIKQLKEKLGIEDVDTTGAVEGSDYEAPSPINGKDVNWDDYNLAPGTLHLYEKAELRDTADGPKWTVEIDEFYTASRSYEGSGLNAKGIPNALGDFITYIVNGPEKWKLMSIIPNGTASGAVLFQRKARMVLPDPEIFSDIVVDEPTTEELKNIEDAALKWAGGNDGQPNGDGESGEEIPSS